MNNCRREIKFTNSWWDKLSLTQKFYANSLTRFGYHLEFIRQTETGPLAIFTKGQKLATIHASGKINLCPAITLRQKSEKNEQAPVEMITKSTALKFEMMAAQASLAS